MASKKADKTETGIQPPYFIKAISEDYRTKRSHIFILHGNIYDNIDNNGVPMSLDQLLSSFYDDEVNGAPTGKVPHYKRIVVFYNIGEGMKFRNEKSREAWKKAHEACYGKKEIEENWPSNWDEPKTVAQFINAIYVWRYAGEFLREQNKKTTDGGKSPSQELRPTFVITDADAFVPNGDISSLDGDRVGIVAMRNLARDISFRNCSKIILLSRHLTDINDSVRSELSTSYSIKKPAFEDRQQWLVTFDKRTQEAAKTYGAKVIDGKEISKVNYAPDFSAQQFAVQSAGMNIRQMADIIYGSWLRDEPIDYSSVMSRKQQILADEYGGMLDFQEPEYGFELVGGHKQFLTYCQRKIIYPLQSGDKRLCSRGALLNGPPGTGKTHLAKALAKEAKMNFLLLDLGKVFGSLVGETEKNIRRIIEGIESAAPCIVFVDEIDSVLSSGRQSSGDSGTSARVFNSFMSWMSDPGRAGRIVVIAASNRPDLLDEALIRSGRFDVKVPILPPGRGNGEGRKEIIVSLVRKLGVKFSQEIKDTEKNAEAGLGKLLWDDEKIWTGAEIEVVLKEAFDSAVFAARTTKSGEPDYTIKLEDLTYALDSVVSRTGAVDRQIKLALCYTDNRNLVPQEYKELFDKREEIAKELGITL